MPPFPYQGKVMHVVVCIVHFICILWKQDRNSAIVIVLTNHLYKVGGNEVTAVRIGVIQASSQIDKNSILYESTKQYAINHDVVNFGCYSTEESSYSYIEISLEIGFLLVSGAVDFVVTGCSSGQGMMLACNSIPGVICGYAPTPMDAYLFAQINNGNAVSLPLGENYTYSGSNNCRRTIEKLFSEPFGQGYPKQEAKRKIKDTELLKDIRGKSQIDFISFIERLDNSLLEKVLKKNDVVEYVITNGSNKKVTDRIKAI